MPSSEHRAFPVALNLASRAVLVIGGGDEADDKVPKLLQTGARVTLVATEASAPLRALANQRAITWFVRGFQPSDLYGAHVVMLTEPDEARARELCQLQLVHRFWLCAIDQPALSDIFLVSTVVRGPVQIGISTGGAAPLLARRLRQALEHGLDARFTEFARNFAELRAALRSLPKAERTARLTERLNGFAMEVRLRYPASEGDGAGPPPEVPHRPREA